MGSRDGAIWLDRGAAKRMDRGFTDFEAWRDQVLEQEEIEQENEAWERVMRSDVRYRFVIDMATLA